jgi:hypothetical protein
MKLSLYEAYQCTIYSELTTIITLVVFLNVIIISCKSYVPRCLPQSPYIVYAVVILWPKENQNPTGPSQRVPRTGERAAVRSCG